MSVICAEISVLALATLSLDFFISPNILSKLETKILKYFANISISSFDLISRRLVRSPSPSEMSFKELVTTLTGPTIDFVIKIIITTKETIIIRLTTVISMIIFLYSFAISFLVCSDVNFVSATIASNSLLYLLKIGVNLFFIKF